MSRIRNVVVSEISGELETGNSSTTPLGIGGVFTGTAHNMLNHAIVYISVFADQLGTLTIEQSHDGTNWDYSDDFTVAANTGKNFSINPFALYMRVIYENNGVAQTEFRLQTISKSVYGKPSSHKLGENVSSQDDAELVKANITGENPAGNQQNVGVSDSSNLKVTDAENGLAIAKGEVEGTTFVHKFGNAPDFDNGDGIVTIWDGADDSHINQMRYVYSTTADIDSISSDDAGDTQDIHVFGLDVNYEEIDEVVALNGQTLVPLANNYLRVFRLVNVNSVDNAGHIYCYVNTPIVGGTPTDSTKVRAVIQPGNNQTLMSLYTVPLGKTGYLRDWYAATSGANRNSNYPMELRVRPFGGVFQLKHTWSVTDDGTSAYQHEFTEPEVYQAKTDIEIRGSMSISGGTLASVAAGFDMVLVDD